LGLLLQQGQLGVVQSEVVDQEGQGVLQVVEQVGIPLLESLHITNQVITLVK
jgi:hypothetical protein